MFTLQIKRMLYVFWWGFCIVSWFKCFKNLCSFSREKSKNGCFAWFFLFTCSFNKIVWKRAKIWIKLGKEIFEINSTFLLYFIVRFIFRLFPIQFLFLFCCCILVVHVSYMLKTQVENWKKINKNTRKHFDFIQKHFIFLYSFR